MNSTRYGLLATITVFSACGTLLTPIVAQGQQEQVSRDTEVLTRGPMHEAFAETVSFEPEAGILVNTQPPEPIDEVPPDQELEGDNVQWIAGYWSWDEDSNDFMWVSGVWRNVPPDREWVPGYWNDVGSQYQWVSGYWADTATEEVNYLPEPPKSLERGPSSAAPSDDDVWVPGTWSYADTRYRWRPGYWQPYRRNWSYVPDRYSWTPRGYVFVAGYWDYPIVNRGIIFAPVRFHGGGWRDPGFHYSPVTVIDIGLVVNHLFVRPRYGHYYYGDYYEPRYADRGFYSSVTFARSYNRGFDPIYTYQRWEHRDDRNWERNRVADFDYFRDNRDARPPQTFAALREMGAGGRGFKNREGKEVALATPLAVYAKNGGAAGDGVGPKQKFKELNQASREKIVNERQQLKNFAQKRKQIEKEAAAPVVKAEAGQPAPAVKPSRAKFERSPVVGRKAAQLAPDQAPPKRKQAPAVMEKDPTPDDNTAKKPGDDQTPDQPGKPGRGQAGRGKGKGGDATDDNTAKPGNDPTPDQPGKPGRGQGGNGKGKGGDATGDNAVKPGGDQQPDQPGKPGRGQAGRGKGKGGDATDDNTAKPDKVTPEQPKREVQPEQPKRERNVQPEQPKREVQPEQPKRERNVQPEQPKREVQPEQPKRERNVQPEQPKREVQPEQPKRERNVQPEQPKREVQPEQPKRERNVQPEQPKREAQPEQPKRERQAQPEQPKQPSQAGGGGGGGGGGKGKGKNKDKDAAE